MFMWKYIFVFVLPSWGGWMKGRGSQELLLLLQNFWQAGHIATGDTEEEAAVLVDEI